MTRPKTLTGIFGRVSSKCVNLVYAGSPIFLQNPFLHLQFTVCLYYFKKVNCKMQKMQCIDIDIVSGFCLCVFAKRAKNGAF